MRLHELLLSPWITCPNPADTFASSPCSLRKSHLRASSKNPAKQVGLNLSNHLDIKKLGRMSPSLLPLGQNAAPCPSTTAGPIHCRPQGCLGVHGLGCPERRCPGLSQLQMGAQTQVRLARAYSHLDFMMLQPGEAESCKVTSKENIRYQG